MTKLVGSTKRTEWDRRWGHELPRGWERGRISVDGDPMFSWTDVLRSAATAIIFMVVVSLIFCLSSR